MEGKLLLGRNLGKGGRWRQEKMRGWMWWKYLGHRRVRREGWPLCNVRNSKPMLLALCSTTPSSAGRISAFSVTLRALCLWACCHSVTYLAFLDPCIALLAARSATPWALRPCASSCPQAALLLLLLIQQPRGPLAVGILLEPWSLPRMPPRTLQTSFSVLHLFKLCFVFSL